MSNFGIIIILVDTPIKKYTYLGFDSPNFMRSASLTTFDYALASFNNMRDFSVDITLTNEVNRLEFFEVIEHKLEQLKDFIRNVK